jgi:hypothetical protein
MCDIRQANPDSFLASSLERDGGLAARISEESPTRRRLWRLAVLMMRLMMEKRRKGRRGGRRRKRR